MKHNIRTFAYKNNLKKLNEKFASHLDNPDWSHNRTITVEKTYFASNHAVGHGLNGNNKLVELQTDTLEANSIHILRGYWSSANSTAEYASFNIYINTKANTYRGENLKEYKHLVLVKNGKEYQFDINYRDNDNNKSNNSYRMNQLISDETFIKKHKLLDAYTLFYLDDETVEALQSVGVTVLHNFTYNHVMKVSARGINTSDKSLTFAYETNHTYNSLPCMIKITMHDNEIKTKKLRDLGIETAGYYDHHVNMLIKPEQVKQAKAFAKQVKKIIG